MAISYTAIFKRQLKRLSKKYRHIRSDVVPVIEKLQAGETPGDQIQGVNYTIYKVRVKNTDAQRGKSGGYRLVYYMQTTEDILVLLIYSKTEQSDIEVSMLHDIITEEGKV